jgi:hypothetical protein
MNRPRLATKTLPLLLLLACNQGTSGRDDPGASDKTLSETTMSGCAAPSGRPHAYETAEDFIRLMVGQWEYCSSARDGDSTPDPWRVTPGDGFELSGDGTYRILVRTAGGELAPSGDGAGPWLTSQGPSAHFLVGAVKQLALPTFEDDPRRMLFFDPYRDLHATYAKVGEDAAPPCVSSSDCEPGQVCAGFACGKPVAPSCLPAAGPTHPFLSATELTSLVRGRWELCSGYQATTSLAGLELEEDNLYVLVRTDQGELVRDPKGRRYAWFARQVASYSPQADQMETDLDIELGGSTFTYAPSVTVQDNPRRLLLDDGGFVSVLSPVP